MRNRWASIVVGLLPFAPFAALPACSTAQVEALKPRNARAAYAEAEVFLIGALNAADALGARGVLSQEQLLNTFNVLFQCAKSLDDAYKLLQTGETIEALAKIDAAQLDMDRIALALSMASEAFAKAAQTPTRSAWSPSSI